MALTYPLTAPTSPAPRTFDLIYDSGASVSASPFTTQVQTFEHERLHWSAAVTLPPMKDDPDGRKWHGFLISLRGKVGTFYMTPPDHATPSGTERNNFQLASTALIRADEISVQSMTPGATMLVGDLMQISNRLYMVAEDMTADGSGTGTIKLTHGMRAQSNGLTNVVVLNPKGKWRLSSSQATKATDQANIANISFSMVEAI